VIKTTVTAVTVTVTRRENLNLPLVVWYPPEPEMSSRYR